MKNRKHVDWDTYFMAMAYTTALRSKDKSTQLGAVIVGEHHEVRSVGYNSFPRGINDHNPDRQKRPWKYFFFEHSERNAIYNAARTGIPVKGCTLYTQCYPCADCARAIINSGIKEVVIDKKHNLESSKDWNDSCRAAKEMFEEAEIVVRRWDGDIPEIKAGFRT